MTVNTPRPPKARPELTVDIVIFTVHKNKLVALLVERDQEPFAGQLALPGGYVWQGETAAQTAKRIIDAKVGDTNIFFEQLYTFDSLDRDPRGAVVSVAYFALVPETVLTEELRDNIVIKPVALVGKLAFDHNKILEKASRRLQNKLLYSNIAFSLLPEHFTLGELQTVYETILGRELDKRNFRKKILSLDILASTAKRQLRSSHRPAMLYRFAKHRYAELGEPAF